MPPTRLGHSMISSVQPGSAAHESNSPITSNGTAPDPCPAYSAPIRNRLWFDPPMASAVVPSQPIVRGCFSG